jgi:Phage-related protein
MAEDAGAVGIKLSVDGDDVVKETERVFEKAGKKATKAVDDSTKKVSEKIKSSTSEATNTVKKASEKMKGHIKKSGEESSNSFGKALGKIGFAITAALSVGKIIEFGKTCIDVASKTQSALTGLSSIVNGMGGDFTAAKGFINDYVKDGLVPLNNAVTAYKNLTARGYNEDQVKSVLTAFKNSATYGRQASLSMGDAVQSATEGIKNQNSVLVDNVGVTKNVAKMHEDFAKSIGKSTANLTQAERIQAEVSGIMEATKFQMGDAAKYADTYAGKTAKLSAQMQTLYNAVGRLLIPIASYFIPYIQLALEWLTKLADGIAKVFGIDISFDISGPLTTAGDAAANLGDEISDVGKKAKKATKNLFGFDEINSLSKSDDSDTGGAGGGASAGGGSLSMAPLEIPPLIDNSGLDGFFGKFKAMWRGIKDFVAPYVESIKEGWSKVEWGKVFDNFAQAKENVKIIFNDINEIFSANMAENKRKIEGGIQNVLSSLAYSHGTVVYIISDITRGITERVKTFIKDNKVEIETYLANLSTLFSTGLNTIADVISGLTDVIKKNWDNHLGGVFEGIIGTFLDIYGWILKLFNDLLYPLFMKALGWIQKIWNENLKGVVDEVLGFVGRVSEIALLIWKNFIKPIVDWIIKYLVPVIKPSFDFIIDTIMAAVNFIVGTVKHVIGIINGIIDFLVGVFTGDWEKAWGGIQKIFGHIWGLITTAFDFVKDTFLATWDFIKNTAIGAVNAIKNIIFSVLSGIKNFVFGVLDGIKNFIENSVAFVVWLFNGGFEKIWEKVKEIFGNIVEFIRNAITNAKETIDNTIEKIKSFFINGFTSIYNFGHEIGEKIRNFFREVLEKIKGIFQSATNGIKIVWDTVFGKIWSIVQEIFGKIKAFISAVIESIKNFIKDPLGNIKNTFTTVFTTIWDFIKGIFDKIKGTISTVINTVKDTVKNTIDNIKNFFVNGFNSIFDFVKGIFDKIKGFFTNTMDNVKGIFKGAVDGVKKIWNSIQDFVKAPINFVIKGLNALIDGLNKISFDIPDWVPAIGGQKFGINIPKVPMLATGGIIDQPTLAMVGESGKEAVMPLENNTEWIDKLAATLFNVMSAGGQPITQSNTEQMITVIFNLNDIEFARAILPALRREESRVGSNVNIVTVGE